MKFLFLLVALVSSLSSFANCRILPKVEPFYQKTFDKSRLDLQEKGYTIVDEGNEHDYVLELTDGIKWTESNESYRSGVALEVFIAGTRNTKYLRQVDINEYVDLLPKELRLLNKAKTLLKKFSDCAKLQSTPFDIEL